MQPTIQQIIEAIGGNVSRDGESVVIGYGANGYLRAFPDSIILSGEELPAVRIEGRLQRRNGGLQAELRSKIQAAGLHIR